MSLTISRPFDALDPQDTCNALRSVSPSGRTPLDKIALLPPRSQPLLHTWRSILDARLRQAGTASRRWAMPPIVETSFHSARASSRLPDSRLFAATHPMRHRDNGKVKRAGRADRKRYRGEGAVRCGVAPIGGALCLCQVVS